VRWRENGRRRFKGGFTSKALADALLLKIRAELQQQRAGLPSDPTGLPRLQAEWDRWIVRRAVTHRDAVNDRSRWKRHLGPTFGRLRAPDVTPAVIRAFVENRIAAGLNPATVGSCVRLLSTFFSDLVERPRETGATSNPVRAVTRATRRLYKATHRPEDTPFIRTLADVVRLHGKLLDPAATAFAIGVFGGLRTGEVLALEWANVDLVALQLRVVQSVRHSKLSLPKDGESRTVPILDALAPVLTRYKLRTGGKGFLFQAAQPGRRAGRRGTLARFMRPGTLHEALAATLADLDPKLPEVTWYQATRHTFASQWVISGGNMERLALILGHSSTEVTRRYAHLKPEHLGAEDRARMSVVLSESHQLATERGKAEAKNSGKVVRL
jgi:integrase